MLFLLESLCHVEGGEEGEYIRLKQTVEKVEVSAGDNGYAAGDNVLDELHNDECAEDVTEKSHTQRQGTGNKVQQIYGVEEAFEPISAVLFR